jgi:sugar O-acyltransferase (sialic acid O-acetyltransferase NeuD family)
MNVGFLGYGELGHQVELLLNLFYPKANKIYFDDFIKGEKIDNCLSFLDYKKYLHELNWLVCLGYKNMDKRLEIINEISKSNFSLLTLVHPTSYVSSSAILSPGVFIYPMCNIDKQVYLGKGVLLNNSVVISHNCEIQDGSYISPGVILSGNVKVGQGSFIGSGTIVSNGISIGDNVYIGVGSVITKNVPEHSWVIGNPQKILEKPFKLY